MSERAPERRDERPSFSPTATVVFAGIAAATVTMAASSAMKHAHQNVSGFTEVQGRVDNAPVERSQPEVQNPRQAPAVQKEVGIVSERASAVLFKQVRVEDGGSRVSEGGNYGRDGGVKNLPLKGNNVVGVKRSIKVPGVSRDADSKVSVAEAARAKLDKRTVNLAALSEYQLRGIVHSAVEDVLKSGRLPLRKNLGSAKTFKSKLDEYRVDRLAVDRMIKDAVGEISAGKKERRDEMRREDRNLLGKDSGLNVSDDEIGSVSYADVEGEEMETAKMHADRAAYEKGYVEWIEGLNQDKFDSKDVARSGGSEGDVMSDAEFGELFEEHFADNGVPDAVLAEKEPTPKPMAVKRQRKVGEQTIAPTAEA